MVLHELKSITKIFCKHDQTKKQIITKDQEENRTLTLGFADPHTTFMLPSQKSKIFINIWAQLPKPKHKSLFN
jgi:hypothetical protein